MPSVPTPVRNADIAALRHFNRFYTRTIGVLDQHLLNSPFSLTEARVLYELAQRETCIAKEIGAELGLDPGYLSRIVQSFLDAKLITRTPAPEDKRQFRLALTAKGRTVFGKLNSKQYDSVAGLLGKLPPENTERLIAAMAEIERLLDPDRPRSQPTLRTHRPGDMGWIVAEHGRQYAEQYGFDASFESLTAEITAKFLSDYDETCERCWIAELDGKPVGSVFLVKHTREIAKLRLFLVDPAARGRGAGKMLVNECVSFARACGYTKITLWTQSILVAARGIYKNAGFVHTGTEPHASFGQQLIGETWELDL
ncbi:MAG: MarR family transcriptional regulator [Proteobacteria bacterium SG_bin9]|nr:MAG: MarR family transcriptional regulator [Proteobacteria bacterium SG_bin9]